jgi:hypothetical protein
LDPIDLKEIERRAYTSYHEDGILDIFIGIGILIAAMYMMTDLFWMAGASVAVFTLFYIQVKKNSTFPRLGQVTFSKSRTGRSKKTMLFIFLLNVVGLLLGVVFFSAVSGPSNPAWFGFVIRWYGVVLGVVIAGVEVVFAQLSDLERFNWYAAVTLVVILSVHLLGTPFFTHLAVLGAVVTVAGLYQLQRFRLKYPLVAGEAEVAGE